METRVPIVILNEKDAKELGVNPLDRIVIKKDKKSSIGIVDTTKRFIEPGSLGLTYSLEKLKGKVKVSIARKPDSIEFIKKKLDAKELGKNEIRAVVNDINENKLSDIELGSWTSAIYSNGMNLEETKYLTKAMVDVGERVEWEKEKIADKHSIGGTPGNRTTPIVVPIVASAGITIPKTSSRAITSPAGTADTMEVFSKVEFSIKKLKEIVNKTNGCIVWGGAVNLSPVDDKIIRAENPLSLDPRAQILASVLSKKRSAGSTRVIIDIPFGENTKVENIREAEMLGEKFKALGGKLGMKVECAVTKGEQPIGRGIGPNLEAKDVLKVLKGNGPRDLREKSLRLSNMLLELCGKKQEAGEILTSGKGLQKFREIVKVQGGKKLEEEEIPLGKFKEDLKAEQSGYLTFIDNRVISEIARRSGAPVDKAAGIYLHRKKGEKVKKGEPVLTVYSERLEKLEDGIKVCGKEKPYRIGKKEEVVVEEL